MSIRQCLARKTNRKVNSFALFTCHAADLFGEEIFGPSDGEERESCFVWPKAEMQVFLHFPWRFEHHLLAMSRVAG